MSTWGHASTVSTLLVLAACGGQTKDAPMRNGPITDAGSGGRTSSGGTSGSAHGTTATGGARATGSGGIKGTGGARPAGGATGAGGLDGSVDTVRCAVTDDHATIDVEVLRNDGGAYFDDGGPGGRRDETYEGVVQQVDGASFVVNTCAPDFDCSVTTIRVTIAAPDLQFGIPYLGTGSLVHVHFVGYCLYGCHASIVVRGLKTWGGLTNQSPPVGADFYVAADDGGGTLPDFPYRWDAVRLPCSTSFEGGCGGTDEPAGVYALRFDNQVVVPMGESGYAFYGGYGIMFRNLRSYVSGACDDYWNYAHWAMPMVFGD